MRGSFFQLLTRMLLASVVVMPLTACSDAGPTAMADPDVVETPDSRAMLMCTASTVSRTVSCAAPDMPAGASAIVLGGQGVYVNLTSSNVSYDEELEIFQFDVTVQNLLNEAIGLTGSVTHDPFGLHPDSPDPEGIQVFFAREPAAVTGTGTITVANPDGLGDFTGTDQPFFAYNEILVKDAVSAAKTWQLNVPSTVTTFDFGVYLETDVEYLLVINEALVNPAGTTMEAAGEWFEVYNAGTLAVDMQGLVIADSAASGRRPYHLISTPLVVEPGLSVVLGNNTNTTTNGGAPVDYAFGSAFSLASSLDAIKIARVVGSDTLTVDRTQYSQASVSAKDGISRELKNPALDNSNMDGSNWADASVTSVYGSGGRGTPGAQNSTYEPGFIVTEKPLLGRSSTPLPASRLQRRPGPAKHD